MIMYLHTYSLDNGSLNFHINCSLAQLYSTCIQQNMLIPICFVGLGICLISIGGDPSGHSQY